MTASPVGAPQVGRELDALVAERVMGLRVAGKMCAVFVEGEWSLHPDSEPEGWLCYAGIEPVYARADCDCSETEPVRVCAPELAEAYRTIDAARDERQALSIAQTGHRTYCLSVVPEYSTDIRAAWEVVEKLNETERWPTIQYGPTEGGEDTLWFVQLVNPADVEVSAESAPLAICLAALRAVGALTPQEPRK